MITHIKSMLAQLSPPAQLLVISISFVSIIAAGVALWACLVIQRRRAK